MMPKTHSLPAFAATALVLAAHASFAQTPAAASDPKAAVAASPAPANLPSTAANAASDKRVIEDEQVRIEETRLRGQTQYVKVQSKLPGVRAYEVIMPPPGKDPSQDKGAAGKRTWSLFAF